MAKALVIVESPAKARTINKYLGKQYIVKASLGHVKDLPKKDLAVDVENGFEPRYEVIDGKKKLLHELKQAAKKVEEVYLAADPDREGEAICYHLQEELQGGKNGPRVSAGRVQTVALRVVVEREREIKAFVPREYWTLDAELHAKKPPHVLARLIKVSDGPAEVASQEVAEDVLAQLEGAAYIAKSVGTREKKRNPVAPFITSTLQQESARKLRFSVKRTMMLAQRLYEGIEVGKEGAVGLITYMRTDSTRVSQDALSDARFYIAERYGKEFLPDAPNIYKSKKDAQDAHEAIRPK